MLERMLAFLPLALSGGTSVEATNLDYASSTLAEGTLQ